MFWFLGKTQKRHFLPLWVSGIILSVSTQIRWAWLWVSLSLTLQPLMILHVIITIVSPLSVLPVRLLVVSWISVVLRRIISETSVLAHSNPSIVTWCSASLVVSVGTVFSVSLPRWPVLTLVCILDLVFICPVRLLPVFISVLWRSSVLHSVPSIVLLIFKKFSSALMRLPPWACDWTSPETTKKNQNDETQPKTCSKEPSNGFC